MNLIEFLGKLMDSLGQWQNSNNLNEDEYNRIPHNGVLIEFSSPSSLKPIIEISYKDSIVQILVHHGLNLNKDLSIKYFNLHFFRGGLVITGRTKEVEYIIFEKIKLEPGFNTINNMKHYPMYISITVSRVG